MGDSGLTRLQIAAYVDSDFTKRDGDPYVVMINPEKYSHGYKIRYTDPQAQGSSGGSPRFNKVPSETVTFEIVFDGTGVVTPSVPGTPLPVSKQIERFKNVVFSYSGKIHSPKFLTLTWGTLLFRCRLSSMDLTYTLFRPDGAPLRATAKTSYLGYSDEEELAKQANATSPDLTHLLTVKAGDTLPLLCWDVYGTSELAVKVARANGLTNFRNIPPGTTLVFPPLAEAPV